MRMETTELIGYSSLPDDSFLRGECRRCCSVTESTRRCSDSQKGRKNGHENVRFWVLDGFVEISATLLERMAGTTRLELATSAVTGQRSNQLNYVPNVAVTTVYSFHRGASATTSG